MEGCKLHDSILETVRGPKWKPMSPPWIAFLRHHPLPYRLYIYLYFLIYFHVLFLSHVLPVTFLPGTLLLLLHNLFEWWHINTIESWHRITKGRNIQAQLKQDCWVSVQLMLCSLRLIKLMENSFCFPFHCFSIWRLSAGWYSKIRSLVSWSIGLDQCQHLDCALEWATQQNAFFFLNVNNVMCPLSWVAVM